MKVIVVERPGEPDVLQYVDRPVPIPGPGQALVKVSAAGVNFMDIGARRGMAWQPDPTQSVLGVEGAGTIVAVGAGVGPFKVGQRVAWVYAPGSYAEQVLMAVDSLVHVPDAIDDHTAAAVMMQGLTASHFATDFYPVRQGDVALVHAAAGGLGLLLTQLIKLRGGRVIGRVSNSDKRRIAQASGADHVIVDAEGKFSELARSFTGGKGVDVVYDGSGPTTFSGSIGSLRPSGTLCWYGPILGGPGPLDIMSLPNSIKIGYARFFDHVPTPEALRARTMQLFDWIIRGDITVNIGRTYALRDAALAHADMESRTTTGKLLLTP